MGYAIKLLFGLSSSIKSALLILVPELVFAVFSFKIVKDQNRQLKIFLWLSVLLLVAYSCIYGLNLFLTKNLLQHEYADYENGTKWNVKIYNNENRSGDPIFDGKIWGLENGLQIDWGFNSPKRNLPRDQFFAEFTTTIELDAGKYCFVVLVDDGANLFVDGTGLIYHLHGFTPEAVFKEPIYLQAGSHQIQLQYYEDINTAYLHLFWYKLSGDACESINEP